MSPHKYTNSELVDMILIYGETGQSYQAARRRYAEVYPNRHLPSVTAFGSLVHRVRETGTLQAVSSDVGCEKSRRSLQLEEAISDAMQNNPSSSIRQIARDLNMSYGTVHRAVKDSGISRPNSSRCQSEHNTLEPDVYPARIAYCQWLIERYTERVDFPLEILFTDEACFTQDGIFNIHNQDQWTPENHVGRFSVNVWAGIVDNSIIGPFILPDSVTKQTYRQFLENDLQPLLEDVTFNIRRQMWFQHTGSTPYFRPNILKYLNYVFEDRCITRGGPVAWPPCSPDLSPIEFFFWSYMGQIVYTTKINTVDELRDRIQQAAKIIKRDSNLENVMQSIILRACTCIQAGGSSFHHLL